MTTSELTISGMTCEHCVSAVTGALRGVPGVESVDVRVGRAVVVGDEEVCAMGALIQAVRSAGYQVSAFRRIAAAGRP